MKKKEDDNLTNVQKIALIREGKIFCPNTFFTGIAKKFVNFLFETILSPEFLVWAAFSFAFFFAVFKYELYTLMWIWLIYAGISFIFIVARSIRHLLENKTTLEIKAQASASATAALTGSISELAGTVIDKIGGKNDNT